MDTSIVSDDTSAVSDSETTKYDEAAFKKLLNQRKADKQKAEELSSKLKEVEEKLSLFTKKEQDLQTQKLQEQGDYKAILEQREKTIQELHDKLNQEQEKAESYEKNFVDMKKISALTDAIGGKLKHKKFYSLIETDKIVIDPVTGAVDEASLKDYANSFVKEFKDVIAFSEKRLPTDAAKSATTLSYEQWLELTKTDPKEARLRMKDVKK
jgi:predicted RNase H-like nuclease (RuvC/YqgF family)